MLHIILSTTINEIKHYRMDQKFHVMCCFCLLEHLMMNSAILLILLTLLITLFIHFVTKYLVRNTQETEQTSRNSIKQLKNFNWMQDSDN